jgi:L-ribulose-5-phosphate 4-epimerase
MFAQALREIPCLGTTHADHFVGSVPLTRFLTEKEVSEGYERETGKVIVERFAGMNPLETPAALVAGHGPFAWGKSATDAVQNGLIVEKVAEMAFGSFQLNPAVTEIPKYIQEKHYRRKHGPKAYYGQEKS